MFKWIPGKWDEKSKWINNDLANCFWEIASFEQSSGSFVVVHNLSPSALISPAFSCLFSSLSLSVSFPSPYSSPLLNPFPNLSPPIFFLFFCSPSLPMAIAGKVYLAHSSWSIMAGSQGSRGEKQLITSCCRSASVTAYILVLAHLLSPFIQPREWFSPQLRWIFSQQLV